MDLAEFLLFCKHFKVPINSQLQLLVYKRIVEQSPDGKLKKSNFKQSIIMIFEHVAK